MRLLSERQKRLRVQHDGRGRSPAVRQQILAYADERSRCSGKRRPPLPVDENALRAVDGVLELVALNDALGGRRRFLDVSDPIKHTHIFQIDDFLVLNEHKTRVFHQQHHTDNRTAEIVKSALKKGKRDHGQKRIGRVEQDRNIQVRSKS